VREWLLWLADYLAGVRAFARDGLTRGDTPEAIADAAGFARFVGDRLPADRHGMPRRHHATVLKIIEEEIHSPQMNPDGPR
jgi:hypothetical protein